MKPKIHNHYQPPCCGEMIDEMTRILDACCGSRMCWFDKHNPEAVYMDIRQETDTLCDGRTLEVKPDMSKDGLHSGMTMQALKKHNKPEANLSEQIAHKAGGGTSQLNPLYVTEMMGYPLEWLTLPFLSQSGEAKASKR